MPSPAASDVVGDAEADAVAEQMAERPARIGERRLAATGGIEPGAMDAGDPPVERSVTAASSAGQISRGAPSCAR